MTDTTFEIMKLDAIKLDLILVDLNAYDVGEYVDTPYIIYDADDNEIFESVTLSEVKTFLIGWSACMETHKVTQIRGDIGKLSDWTREKRSDISELLSNILEGEQIKESDIEHRYVQWSVNDIDYEYDTLTTLVSVYRDGDWHEVECGYVDESNNRPLAKMLTKKLTISIWNHIVNALNDLYEHPYVSLVPDVTKELRASRDLLAQHFTEGEAQRELNI